MLSLQAEFIHSFRSLTAENLEYVLRWTQNLANPKEDMQGMAKDKRFDVVNYHLSASERMETGTKTSKGSIAFPQKTNCPVKEGEALRRKSSKWKNADIETKVKDRRRNSWYVW